MESSVVTWLDATPQCSTRSSHATMEMFNASLLSRRDFP